jgi:Spy/CpxP family protein refolding chaperone
MNKSLLSIALLGLSAFSGAAFADAPLKSALDLTVDQARQADEIQAVHRLRYAEQRGKTNTEERKLRRARIANDSQQIAILEKTTEEMKAELRKIKASEDAAIRELLTPEQNTKFDAYIEQREAMVGSSRDVRNQRPSTEN